MTSQQWVDSLQGAANPIFTPGCFEIGFNVGNETGAPLRARLGIVSTHGAGRHNYYSYRSPYNDSQPDGQMTQKFRERTDLA
jgi:hypothetical protein